MKPITLFFLVVPFFLVANLKKVPSKIKEVTVYLSGAQITRTAKCSLVSGTNEIVFSGLSHKIDESSIQVSGLYGVSILSIAYDINYLEKSESNPQLLQWEENLKNFEYQITLLQNTVYGLEEEEKVITTNRMVSTDNQALDLEKVKSISQYYRERLTAIKNEIFEHHLSINELKKQAKALKQQMAEVNNTPAQEQGEITIKFDAPVTTQLSLTLNYMVKDAGWVPNYDIKSNGIDAPLALTYKANVYQNTGKDWDDVAVILSTGNPNYNISKPELRGHFLNFTSAYAKKYAPSQKKKGYAFNPAVKKVAGTVTDQSGTPLPGVTIVIKGTNKGTQTDFDGNYELDVPYGQELSFSYIGMHSQEIPLYSSIINLSMEESAEYLDEVVVTAMGVSRESNALGYAVGSAGALAGRATGIKIRGVNSTPYAPLYIIDGIPVEGFVEGDLDANEIQSIDVLKGQDAAALYGNRAATGVVVITTKKSSTKEGATKTEFAIKKRYTVSSDNDITAIEINSINLNATYEYFAAPVINENVFLTAQFSNWEEHQLLPGEANIYFEGTYAGKTVLDPYTTKKEMVLSLGIDPNISVTRKQERNFKRKSFSGNHRILDRTYTLEIKNNKSIPVKLKLLDRIPQSENKEIKVDDIVINNADLEPKNGLLTWALKIDPKKSEKEQFSFQVKYPRGKYISL